MIKELKKKKKFFMWNIALWLCMMVLVVAFSFANQKTVYAAPEDETTTSATVTDGDDANNQINIGISTGDGSDMASVLQMVLVLTVLALAPSILIMLTSFTRIIIVLHFTRTAIGTNTAPPNQVLIGLALFLTFFIMAPVFSEINENAIKPLSNEEITMEEAFDAGVEPLKEFMLNQTREKDIRTFIEVSGMDVSEINDPMEDIPLTVVIPSFIISELRVAFIIGFLIYIPFLIIDMVVSSTLMSMGMMMLPPTTISLPFKILLFVMADGWNLIIGSLVTTFR